MSTKQQHQILKYYNTELYCTHMHTSGRLVVVDMFSSRHKELNDDRHYTRVSGKTGAVKIHNNVDNSYDANNKLNKFWAGARGFEAIGKVKDCGIFCSGQYDSIRMVLRQIHNHACMLGDEDTLSKAVAADAYFHCDKGISLLVLPQYASV